MTTLSQSAKPPLEAPEVHRQLDRQARRISQNQAELITRSASKQAYYTIRLFVSRAMIPDAFRAYAYFRWVDDRLDLEAASRAEKLAFLAHQRDLIERCYQGDQPAVTLLEEAMLVHLIGSDHRPDSGLRAYIHNMMKVMAFDARRHHSLVSQEDLDGYTYHLAVAVTEALHYFIGGNDPGSLEQGRYMAATGAHITHMLRDTLEDLEAGYFNIPDGYLQSHGISPYALTSQAYKSWVRERVGTARSCFQAGRAYLSQVQNLKLRWAGYAYIARFESVLDTIEEDGYQLRPEYERQSGVAVACRTLGMALAARLNVPDRVAVQLNR